MLQSMKRGKKQGEYIQGNKVDLIKCLAANQIKAVHLNLKKKNNQDSLLFRKSRFYLKKYFKVTKTIISCK